MTNADRFPALESILTERRSVKQYDPEHTVDDATLRTLFHLTSLSPSSFNLQHWRFVVVREAEHKQALREAAFHQPQVESASAAIVVCGKLGAWQDAERIYADAPPDVRKRMVPMIHGLYGENPTLQRDEAIRSGALAAMTLMTTARAMGLATGPMIGFDPVRVSELVRLPDDHVPVMLVVLGKQTGTMRPRMARHPLSETVKLETFDGEGLA